MNDDPTPDSPAHSRRESRSSHGPANPPPKRSSRIEKPRSIHGSPTGLGRRKTTSAVKRYVTLEDRWDMMFGSGEAQETQDASDGPTTTTTTITTSTRPVSWHPASTHHPDSFAPSPANDLPDQKAGYAFPEPSSAYPSPASGYASYPALAYLSALAERRRDFPIANIEPDDASMDTEPFPPYRDSCMPDPAVPPPSFATARQSGWPSLAPPTSHPRGSPEFLPMQRPDDEDCYMEGQSPRESSGKVLVGMGLYDPPSYESMLTSGLGKGLKLEETWQPPAEAPSNDDGDDESSDEESVEEAPEPARQPEDGGGDEQHWALPADLSGRSFLLEDEETYTNEWWYQQLKRPTAQDGGLGFGWLHQTRC